MTANNFVLTTLSQNPEYFEEVIKLIEKEFYYSEEHSYEKDFAPLVNPFNFEHCYLYIDKDSNTVAAHLAVCLRTLVKSGAEMNVAFIGGIVTDTRFRGKNLFKDLMNHALETHKNRVALFVLWSGLEGIYEKFHFYRTGGLIESGKRNFSATDRPSGYEKTKFSLLSEKEFQSIIHLYRTFNESYFFTVKREDKDWSIIREMDSIDLFVKKNSAGGIENYFCTNKGRDLTDIIHEVSCTNHSDYPSFIKKLESFKLWLPETEINSLTKKEIFYTAFMKLGNIALLNSFLKLVSNNELVISQLDEVFVLFRFKGKDYEATSKDFLQYLFGPKPLMEFAGFGLSLYVAGADSI